MIRIVKTYPFFAGRLEQAGKPPLDVWETTQGVFAAVPLGARPEAAGSTFAFLNVMASRGKPPRIEARGTDCHGKPYMIVGDGLPGLVVTAAAAVHMGHGLPPIPGNIKRIR